MLSRLVLLAMDSLHGGTNWVQEKAEDYIKLLRYGLIRIGFLCLIPAALYALGAALNVAWLLSLAMLFLGLLTVGLMVIAEPIFTGVAAAARAFPKAPPLGGKNQLMKLKATHTA